MAFTAVLQVSGTTLAVLEFHWALTQDIDGYSKPQRFIHGGQIHLVVDHLSHAVLDNWMANPQLMLDGSLVVFGIDGTRFRTISFQEAFCVGEGLYFNSTGIGRATSLSILISAKHLLIDDTVAVANA